MLTRRTLLLSTVLTGVLLAAPRAWAQSTADATAFINRLGASMLAVVNGPGTAAEKKKKLAPIIEAAVDVDGIARFSLGRFWRTATPEQQVTYSRLFHDVLLNNIGGKIGEFQGVTYTMTSTTQKEGDIAVGMIITRPNQAPNNVQWVVNAVGGSWKVVDVIAEGTSLRLTQRQDYAAYLTRNGNNVDALITAMKQQLQG